MPRGPTAASFPAADEDYFHDMDGGVALTREEIKGRNMWIVWTGGNDRLLGRPSPTPSFGTLDFLKTLSSHPTTARLSRDNRWKYLGLVNEPCFDEGDRPRSQALRPVARQASRRLPARSVRRTSRSIRA